MPTAHSFSLLDCSLFASKLFIDGPCASKHHVLSYACAASLNLHAFSHVICELLEFDGPRACSIQFAVRSVR